MPAASRNRCTADPPVSLLTMEGSLPDIEQSCGTFQGSIQSPSIPQPGAELVAALAANMQRPGLEIGALPGSGAPLYVPRASLVVRFSEEGGPELFPAAPEPLEDIVGPDVALAIETEGRPIHALALERLSRGYVREEGKRRGERDLTTGAPIKTMWALYAAALRDIAALTGDEIAEVSPVYSERSPALRAAKRGATLWARMGGWPWCCFRKGKLPDAWPEHPAVAAAFATWASGRLVLGQCQGAA